jgi:cellulose synthase/poly-beta-1,6-N-acetylglucosamine synthase-like glycosyltransferase
MSLNKYRIEIGVTVIGICVAVGATAFFLLDLLPPIVAQPGNDEVARVEFSSIILAGISLAFLYTNVAYLLSRLGNLKREGKHLPLESQDFIPLYDNDAPSLTILIPSYREDEHVVVRALLSAGLAEYSKQRVVLLIDDSPFPATESDAQALCRMRELPERLQDLLSPVSREFNAELLAYSRRLEQGPTDVQEEAKRLSELHYRAATWLEARADEWRIRCHVDSFFVEKILREPARRHRARADWLNSAQSYADVLPLREYRRLAGLFDAEFSSFERKKFANLSREANKAMNLNSYLALMGKSWRVAYRDNSEYLEPSSAEAADLLLPDSQYILTLDADSVILNDYPLRLINVMEAPGNERLAVAQTPYSAFPCAPNRLERFAGATTDIQYFIHQGFTHFNGTYWVGANALIRRQALDDIAVRRTERGFPVTVYVQDKTVIEDTESTIDLVTKGWSLYNYPARLAYSATPSDFGSLLIQRRRWANGGLIILPKLIRHLVSGSPRPGLGEGFLRIHYLISLTATSFAILLLLLVPFEKGLSNIWLPLSLAPYFFLYGRDLVRAGYSWKDLLGIYALNMLLLPVHLGGILRSLQQAITGRKASFGRTPKIRTRTTVPVLYLWATISLLVVSILNVFVGFAGGEWARFSFSLMNTVAFIFVVSAFIGVREFAEDALPRRRRRQLDTTIVGFRPERTQLGSVEQSLAGIPVANHLHPVRERAVPPRLEERRPTPLSSRGALH